MPLIPKIEMPYYTISDILPTGPNEYIAQLTQSGTDAPTANILKNTLGTVNWTRDSQGKYFGSLPTGTTEVKLELLSQLPDVNKFVTSKSSNVKGAAIVIIQSYEIDLVGNAFNNADDILNKTTIYIQKHT